MTNQGKHNKKFLIFFNIVDKIIIYWFVLRFPVVRSVVLSYFFIFYCSFKQNCPFYTFKDDMKLRAGYFKKKFCEKNLIFNIINLF